jgi:hypothetical protein
LRSFGKERAVNTFGQKQNSGENLFACKRGAFLGDVEGS